MLQCLHKSLGDCGLRGRLVIQQSTGTLRDTVGRYCQYYSQVSDNSSTFASLINKRGLCHMINTHTHTHTHIHTHVHLYRTQPPHTSKLKHMLTHTHTQNYIYAYYY